jgi:glycosyltransferase involved in cell wall biosynthesis
LTKLWRSSHRPRPPLLADSQSPRLTIVIPAHHEEDTIGGTLRALHAGVHIPFQAVVVYDLDEDPTVAAVQAGIGEWPEAHLLKNTFGRGALGAIRTGLEAAETELVVVFMADLSDDPEVVNAMVVEADRGADVVSASRYMKGGSQSGGPRLKSLLSRLAGQSLHMLTRIPTHDPTNSFRLYRADLIRAFSIESRGGFEVGLELTVKAYLAGRKVAEVPASWQDRTSGESKFQLGKWLPLYLHWYLYALRRAPFGRVARRTP